MIKKKKSFLEQFFLFQVYISKNLSTIHVNKRNLKYIYKAATTCNLKNNFKSKIQLSEDIS